MTEYKTCTKCGQIKALEFFGKDKYKKSGYTSSCLSCKAESGKKWRANPVNQDSSREKSKAYYHANKEKMAANYDLWVKNNPERRKQIDADFRNRNRAKQADKAKEYRKKNPQARASWGRNNPEKQAALYVKRSFRRRGGKRYEVSNKELAAMYRLPCSYCGGKSSHIDHIVPLARGGEHRIGNLTPACADCNLSKGAKFITEWKKGKNEAR